MRRLIVFLVMAGVLTACGYLYWRYQSTNTTEAKAAPTTTPVERGSLRLTVASTGVVQSNLDVEIKCKASGEIVAFPYDVSDPVEEGTLLVELDPIDEERNVRKAEVQMASSQAQLTQARRGLETAELAVKNARQQAEAELRSAQARASDKQEKAERMKSLLEKKYASPEECETAETEAVAAVTELETAQVRLQEIAVEVKALEVKRQDVVLAQCNVESDTIALENAQQRLDYTKVYAPMSGVVSERYVQKGQIISSPTSNVGGGTALLMLSDLSRVFVVASVDESDIGGIEVGQSADITVDAFPDLHFDGSVVRIATKGQNVSNVVTFEVKIEVLSEAKRKLRPEMTANVEILAADRKDILILPSESVQRKGPRRFVILPGGPDLEGETCTVEIGIDDGLHVEIVRGLEEGAVVLVPAGAGSARWDQDGQRSGPNSEQMRNRMMMRTIAGPPRR